MENENQDGTEVHETTETADETVETQEETLTPEQIADLRAKAEVSSQNFKRAKKAEEELKEFKKGKVTTKSLEVAPKDYLALTQAGITVDDFDEVMDFASYKKISVSEALKNQTLKTILANNKAERATAQATQVNSPRGTKKPSGEELLAKAERGEELEGTSEDMSAIFQARLARKTAHHRK